MSAPAASPFSLDHPAAYAAWRERKLADAPRALDELTVEVDDPRRLSAGEKAALLECIRRANMAIYASGCGSEADKQIPRQLGLQLGLSSLDGHFLTDDDGISPLSVSNTEDTETGGMRREFIPYTNQAIRWHTDGYYNPPQRTVRGMLLHCVESAESGGDNHLLDHEIAYLLLRDENPEFIRALSQPDAMLIPARVEEDGEARPAQPGPVFSVDAQGFLHMRYTARSKSIVWKDDALTQAAVACLASILKDGTPWTFQGRLEAGMGLVCNNVLHDRSAFSDSPARRRLLYRARYYERISG
ncbi:MAG: TauD/TfdA family dioxygenase [Betaproteobacteria bacterium]|nr:TauD/TfdA family dioxygenase [Betaproteobacteria bacterium]